MCESVKRMLSVGRYTGHYCEVWLQEIAQEVEGGSGEGGGD